MHKWQAPLICSIPMKVVIVSHKNKGHLQRIAREHKAVSNLLSEEAEANTHIGALQVKRRGSLKMGEGPEQAGRRQRPAGNCGQGEIPGAR